MNYGLRNQLDEQKFPNITSNKTIDGVRSTSDSKHFPRGDFRIPPLQGQSPRAENISQYFQSEFCFLHSFRSGQSRRSSVFPTAVPDLTAFSQPRQLQLDCDLGKLLGMRVHVSVCSDDTNGVDCHHSAQLTTVMGD